MTKLIGEISSNHNRNLKRCFKFIDVLVIKFYDQISLFKIDKLLPSNVLQIASHTKKEKVGIAS